MNTPRLHFPAPGPLYWDYRCTRCGRAVTDHQLRWWMFWRRETD